MVSHFDLCGLHCITNPNFFTTVCENEKIEEKGGQEQC